MTMIINVKKVTLLPLVFATSLTCIAAQAKVQPLASCSQLTKPKTVLVVYASDCHFSMDYMPKYTQVSNEAEFKEWTFYKKLVNLHTHKPINVCGTIIDGVPMTYTHNMVVKLTGDRSVSELESFLRGSASSQGNNSLICPNK